MLLACLNSLCTNKSTNIRTIDKNSKFSDFVFLIGGNGLNMVRAALYSISFFGFTNFQIY